MPIVENTDVYRHIPPGPPLPAEMPLWPQGDSLHLPRPIQVALPVASMPAKGRARRKA